MVLAVGTTECLFYTKHCFKLKVSPLKQKLLIHRQSVGLCARYREALGIMEKNKQTKQNLIAQRIIGSPKIGTLA